MKTIYGKRIYVLMALITLNSCAQDTSDSKSNKEASSTAENEVVRMDKPETLDMSKEDLNSESLSIAASILLNASFASVRLFTETPELLASND